MKRALFSAISVVSMICCSFESPDAFASDVQAPSQEFFSLEKGLTRGRRGRKGRKGKRGKRGKRGPRGYVGKIGPIGPKGRQGPIGIQGPVGPMGPKGATGSAGPSGATGPTGPAGAMGPVGPMGEPGPLTDERHTYALEEFVSGGLTSGTFGALGWSSTDEAGISYIPAEQDHPGILRMYPTLTGLSSFYLSPNFVTDTADEFDLTFIVRPGNLTGIWSFRVGLGNNLPNAPLSGIYFEKNDSSPYWQIIIKDGGTSTLVTNIPVTATSWYNLRIKRTVAGLSFFINGTAFDPINGNIPVGPLNAFVQTDLQNLGFKIDIDYMSIQWPTLSR